MTVTDQQTAAGITILGATGSIGASTLDVIARHPQRYRVVALTANRDVDTLARQCAEFRPRYAVMADTDAAEQLRARLREESPDVEVLGGADALATVASLVMNEERPAGDEPAGHHEAYARKSAVV